MTDRFLVAGPYRLDLEDERVWRAEASLHLGGKAFALLRALMERPQVLVTKDELYERAWPGLAVSDSVLTTAIKELRRALGDNARNPEVIGTVHGRGYRFLLPVERRAAGELVVASPAGDAVSRGRTRPAGWMAALALGVVGLVILVAAVAWQRSLATQATAEASAASKSVVVLPFADLTPGRSETWFADGMTEEISSSLARAPDLRVISRRAASRFRENDTDVRAVARELDVAHVLTGSVRRDGDHVRVSAQLIRAADGAQLWSQTYDRRDRGVISIQEDIAFHIASSLKSILEPARLRAMVDAGTRSVEAYEAYLRGVALDQRQSDEGDVGYARAAAEEYERARALDPNFAAAHWRSANSWFGNTTRVVAIGRGQNDQLERAHYVARLDAAIAASTDEAERLKYQAARASAQLQIKDAHRLMVRYLEVRPRDMDAWEEMADLSAYAGERRWMARAAERLQTLSMEDGYPRSRAITVSVMALQYDTAVQRSRRQLEARPDNALTQYQAHRAFVWAGRLAEARRLLEQVNASGMPTDTKMLAEIRQACAEGRVEEARILRRSVDAIGRESIRWQAAMLLGDTDGAYRLLLPMDTDGRLPTLMQFLIYPEFDPSAYPNLNARLTHEGVARRAVTPLPYACKTA